MSDEAKLAADVMVEASAVESRTHRRRGKIGASRGTKLQGHGAQSRKYFVHARDGKDIILGYWYLVKCYRAF